MRTGPWTFALALVVACGTLGGEGEEGASPTAGVGPFRKLGAEEVRGLAPFVLDSAPARYREPAVLRDAPFTLLYAVARVNGVDVIVRTRANDERTFFGSGSDVGHEPAVVLAPDRPWERRLSGPTLVRFRGELLLFYAGEEGIGIAETTDGLVFRKAAAPILVRDDVAGSWETAPPRAPSVYVSEDGASLRMFYAAGPALGEAESGDGRRWRRVGNEPVLGPAPPAADLLPGEKPPFDGAGVGDPCAVTRRTVTGRFHVRVLYTGTDAAGSTAIGFAARYGDGGSLTRQRAPVYSVDQHEAAPALLDLGARSYLYVHQDRRDGARVVYPAIAAAVAPVNLVLPPTTDSPDDP